MASRKILNHFIAEERDEGKAEGRRRRGEEEIFSSALFSFSSSFPFSKGYLLIGHY
jgi:hypothetical protein